MSLAAFKKAVVDTPDPTPGYLYRDIAKGTVDQKECAKLIEAIVKKLQKSKSPHELRKTNQVIKAVCEQGGGTFKKDMQEKVEIMRTVAQYRGTADPVHGDSMNEKVRSTGKEAIDAVFRSARADKANLDISGQGANTVEKGKEPSFVTGTTAAGGMGGMGPAGTAGSPTATKNSTVMGQISNAVDTRFGLRPTTERDVFMKEVAAGSHNANESYTPAVAVGFEPATIGGPAPVSAPAMDPGFVAPEAMVQEEEVSEELKLVQKLMKTKTNPTRGQLNTFVQEASESDIQAVCGHLDDALCERQHWQQRLKALFAVEAMLAAEVPAAKHYYQNNPEDILRNSKVVQESLKKKALKVAQMLDLKAAATAPAVVTPTTGNSDLFLNLQQQTTSPPPPSVPGSDMFAGMTNNANVPQQPALVPDAPLAPEAEVSTAPKKKKKRATHVPVKLAGAANYGGSGSPSPPPEPEVSMNRQGSIEVEMDGRGDPNLAPPVAVPMPPVKPVESLPQPPPASPDMPDFFTANAPPQPPAPAPPQPAAPVVPAAPAAPAKSGGPSIDDLFAADPTPFNGSAPTGTPAPTPGIGAAPILPHAGAFAPVAPNGQTAPLAGVPGVPGAMPGMPGMPGQQMTPQQMQMMMQMMQMQMMAGGAAGGFPGMPGMMPPGAPVAPPQPTKADTAFGDLCNAAKDGLKGN